MSGSLYLVIGSAEPKMACKTVKDVSDLLGYDEIVIVGHGHDPMQYPKKVLDVIDSLIDKNYTGDVHLYTSLWNAKGISKEILKSVDGFTFILKHDAGDTEIAALKNLSNSGILQNKSIVSRLCIDSILYSQYDFANINLSRWDVVRKMATAELGEYIHSDNVVYYEP